MLPTIAQILLIYAIVIFGLASKPTRYHPAFFFSALSIYISLLIIPYPDESINVKSPLTSVATFLGAAFNLLVISNPQDSNWRNGDEKPASQRTFLQRVKWAATYTCNPRSANWNNATPGLRYPTSSTRLQFVLSRCREAVFYFLLRDILGSILRRNFFPALQFPPAESMGARGLGWQVVNVSFFWVTLKASIAFNHVLASSVFVASRVSDPDDWPVVFGSWSEATSVRVFWGKTWHQFCRRSIQPQSKYFTQHILHLRPGGFMSRYTQLFACFFLSGLYHAAGDWAVQRDLDSVMAGLKFYVLQAVIIMLEDFIIYIGKIVRVKRVPKLVSYVWVVTLIGLSGPMWMETTAKGGLFDTMILSKEASVVEKVLGYMGR